MRWFAALDGRHLRGAFHKILSKAGNGPAVRASRPVDASTSSAHWANLARRLLESTRSAENEGASTELEGQVESGAHETQALGDWFTACMLWFALYRVQSKEASFSNWQTEKTRANVARTALKGGRVAETMGDWKKAAQLWDCLRVVQPNSEPATRGGARCAKNIAPLLENNENLNALEDDTPPAVMPERWKVDTLFNAGKVQQANALLKRIEAEGSDSVTHSLRARMALQAGKFAEAIGSARAAISFSQREGGNALLISEMLYLFAEAFAAEGTPERAREYLMQELADREELFDRDLAAIYETATDRKGLGELQHFLHNHFRRESPNFFRVTRRHSFALRDLGLMDEAIGAAGDRLIAAVEGKQYGKMPKRADENFSAAARRALRDLRVTAESGGFEFFLISGTLLGYVRENDILAHDKDIDVGLMPDVNMEKLKAHLQSSGLFRVKNLPYETVARAIHCNGTSIDLFQHWEQDGKFFHRGQKTKWWNTPFTTISREFLGETFKVPSNPELYLDENYGDWRAPKEDWDTFLDTPNMVIMDTSHMVWYLYSRLFDHYVQGKDSRFRRAWTKLGDFADIAAGTHEKVGRYLEVTENSGVGGKR